MATMTTLKATEAAVIFGRYDVEFFLKFIFALKE